MQITAANIGNIIELNDRRDFMRIEAVSDRFVTYLHENGDCSAKLGHECDGHVVDDPEIIFRFNKNAELGSVLFAAETKALVNLLDVHLDEPGREAAHRVIDITQRQRKHLEQEILKAGKEEIIRPSKERRNLDDIIFNADKHRNLSSSSKQNNTIEQSFER